MSSIYWIHIEQKIGIPRGFWLLPACSTGTSRFAGLGSVAFDSERFDPTLRLLPEGMWLASLGLSIYSESLFIPNIILYIQCVIKYLSNEIKFHFLNWLYIFLFPSHPLAKFVYVYVCIRDGSTRGGWRICPNKVKIQKLCLVAPCSPNWGMLNPSLACIPTHL